MTEARGRGGALAAPARTLAACVLVLAACLLASCLLASCQGPDLSVPEGRDAVRTVPVGEAEALAASVAAVVPANLGPHERALFARRDGAGAVWSASPMNGFDLTGLSWGGGRAALITDRHVVFSAHTPSPKEGGRLTFYDRDGWPVVRTVTRTVTLAPLGGAPLDAVVGRLDAPVPAGVAVYALPDADPARLAALARARVPVVVTFARGGEDRDGALGWGAFASVSSLARVAAGGARVVYAKETGALDDPRAEHDAQWGDSGSASFLARDGALLLLSHYHTSQGAGAGPNYADPAVQRLVSEAVARLDG